ncbi:hypothetical protein ACIO1C_16765 [Streptomyces sp. NPDC087420]|uniref:hypothetical protein n=1 Tax=Streptomyces sp. NPDC087420 TaxID=3365785 RepID=UPI003837A0FF
MYGTQRWLERRNAERNLVRGRIPGDPRERAALRRLVTHRRHRLESHPWLFAALVPALAVPPALWALQGLWSTALLMLVFGIVFGSWATCERRRNRSRLRFLDRALTAADAAAPAGLHTRHTVPLLVLTRRTG